MTSFATATKTAETDPAKSNSVMRKPLDSQTDSLSQAMPLFGFPIQRKSDCACGGGCPSCQAKSNDLKVSQPNDPAEIEADQIADRVMRMSVDDAKPKSKVSNPSNAIHRKCDGCEEEDEAAETPLMRKEAFASVPPTPPPADTPPSIKNVISSGGQPLDLETRNFFEPRFAANLSHVRIHTDSTAAQSARSVDARAYTLGRDIVFGSGEFAPHSASGRHLLAHELAHVVQRSDSTHGVRRKTLNSAELQDYETDDFTDDDLDTYLGAIGPDIEGTSESDEKARTLVKHSLTGKRSPPSADKLVLMIREMQDGPTGDDDERGILNILLACEQGEPGWPRLSELFEAGGGLSPKSIYSDIDGDEEDTLLAFYERNFDGGQKVADDDTRKLKTKEEKQPTAVTNSETTLMTPPGDSESESLKEDADKLREALRGADLTKQKEIEDKVAPLAAELIDKLIIESGKDGARQNPARLENLREGLKYLMDALSSDKIKNFDSVAGIANRSQDAIVREVGINLLLRDSSGVEGQQRFLKRVALVVGKELPEGTAQKSREWLEANTDSIGSLFTELDKKGIAGSDVVNHTPLSIELSNNLLAQYSEHTDDAPFDPLGKLTKTNVNSSNQIKLDCDGYASYGARLLRAQGWDTVGYMAIIPTDKSDAHAVALANKNKFYLGVSNASIKELGGHAAELELEEAKNKLWSFALEVYVKLRSYDLYYLDATNGGAYDRRLTDPENEGLTPYQTVR